jgi:hypothetical protein
MWASYRCVTITCIKSGQLPPLNEIRVAQQQINSCRNSHFSSHPDALLMRPNPQLNVERRRQPCGVKLHFSGMQLANSSH